MTAPRGAALLARLEADLESFPFPSYLLDTTDNTCTLRSMNALARDLLGEDTLSPRAMEGLQGPLQSCLLDAKRQEFTQLHTVPEQDLWLRTGLMPVSDSDGSVIGVLAQIVDVTEQTDRTLRLSRRNAAQRIAQDRRRMATHDTAADICRALDSSSFARARELALDLRTTARGTMEKRRDLEEVDFARTCAELCAVLDLDDQFRVAYDDGLLITDPVFLHVALRSCLLEAMGRAQKFIAIDLFETPNGYSIVVTDDGPAESTPPLADLETFMLERGGSYILEPSTGYAGNRACLFLPDALTGEPMIPPVEQELRVGKPIAS